MLEQPPPQVTHANDSRLSPQAPLKQDTSRLCVLVAFKLPLRATDPDGCLHPVELQTETERPAELTMAVLLLAEIKVLEPQGQVSLRQRVSWTAGLSRRKTDLELFQAAAIEPVQALNDCMVAGAIVLFDVLDLLAAHAECFNICLVLEKISENGREEKRMKETSMYLMKSILRVVRLLKAYSKAFLLFTISLWREIHQLTLPL